MHFGGDNTDAIYIPSRLAFDFALGIVIFSSQPLFHEVVIPAVLGIITEGPDDFEVRIFISYALKVKQAETNTKSIGTSRLTVKLIHITFELAVSRRNIILRRLTAGD